MMASNRIGIADTCVFMVWLLIASLTPSLAYSQGGLKIIGITDLSGNPNPTIGLNKYLVVKLTGTDPIDPQSYSLFLNGREIAGLNDTQYRADTHALVFRLHRNSDNAVAWGALLGSPSWENRRVSVALGEKKPPAAVAQQTILGDDDAEPTVSLQVFSGIGLAFATVAVALVIFAVWGGARTTSIIKDAALTQIPPNKRPYSLGRWQMAYWFTLVFASFLFLFVLLWDYNTVTEQALTLMGISGATALFAVTIDSTKVSAASQANSTLQALGLNSYADVLSLQQELTKSHQALPQVTDQSSKAALEKKLEDCQSRLKTYENTIKPFTSEGWYRDLTTDVNGPALHRLQVFCWTWILGVVFIIGVYRDFAMPQFSGTLLALMAVTSAGYVGFKYPEKQ
jgi:hypothetical protein